MPIPIARTDTACTARWYAQRRASVLDFAAANGIPALLKTSALFAKLFIVDGNRVLLRDVDGKPRLGCLPLSEAAVMWLLLSPIGRPKKVKVGRVAPRAPDPKKS